MKYQIAERFKSPQGEGVYTGTRMSFIRFVGCSVGKKICQHCDTIFERMLPWQGGGEYSAEELVAWALEGGMQHICLTGGEPADQDLVPLLNEVLRQSDTAMVHVETSGTRMPISSQEGEALTEQNRLWVCVSPKPGFQEHIVRMADEVKVIVPGLGEINPKVPEHWKTGNEVVPGELKRWPSIDDAIRWAAGGKPVFLQPRNGVKDVDYHNLMIVQDIQRDHPQLRISVQMHKILKVQ